MAIRSARIKQGTTAALEVTLEEEAVQDATVYVTIEQDGFNLTKSNYKDNPAVTMEPVYDEDEQQIATDITVIYSQAETLALRPGHGKVQVGWVFEDGSADRSMLGRVEIPEALFKGVMMYG